MVTTECMPRVPRGNTRIKEHFGSPRHSPCTDIDHHEFRSRLYSRCVGGGTAWRTALPRSHFIHVDYFDLPTGAPVTPHALPRRQPRVSGVRWRLGENLSGPTTRSDPSFSTTSEANEIGEKTIGLPAIRKASRMGKGLA